jgi:Zn-dependent protease
VFIPFLGAVVWAKSLGGDAAAEARVGLAGPVLGSLAAAACVVVYALTGDDLWRALAFTGFFLNLFNLLPVSPLDGGRAAAALSPWVWLLGVFGMVVLVLTLPNPIIILIALVAIWQTYHRFRQFRSGDPEVAKYYAISKRQRLLIGATYLVLVVALVVAMDATHLPRTL